MKRMILGFVLMVSVAAFANQTSNVTLDEIKQTWVQAYYKTAEKDQPDAFKALLEKIYSYSTAYGRSVDALIWEATTHACYGKALKNRAGLKHAEEAKTLMHEAEKKPKTTQQEVVIYRTLGTLYYKIPSWPIGFGDKKLAKTYLEKALALDPNGVDTNYFYADFLADQKEYERAAKYYKLAMLGTPSPEGEDAYKGRLREIELGMRSAEDLLRKKL